MRLAQFWRETIALATLAFWCCSVALAESAQEVAKKVSPSVVLLVMEDKNGQPLAMASGFVIKDGVVATNLHVLEGASRGYTKLADRKEKFNITGTVAVDAARDIALLAVEGIKAPALTIRDSKQLAVGDEVYAVGNPRGLEGTFSAGIISSIRKVGDDSLLQITAPISPGSSGGPVVNSRGEVIGVAVATFKGGQLNAWLIKAVVALAGASTNTGNDVPLYDQTGTAIAYLNPADEMTIYMWSGNPVAYLSGKSVYGFNGKHIGWFADGLIYDPKGKIVAATGKGLAVKPKPAPVRGIKQIKPIRAIERLAPLEPLYGITWSDTPTDVFLLQGAK